jgi:hypothetical protein
MAGETVMTSSRRLRLTSRGQDALLILTVLLAFTLGFFANVWWPYTRDLDHHARTTVCEEDQSCWDCHTMGNRICGPTR